MDWGDFFTIIAQIGIAVIAIAVLLVIVGGVVLALIDRKDRT